MTRYRYETRGLYADYARAAAGCVLTGVPLALAPAGGWVIAIFGGLFVMFAVFALRTGARHRMVVDIDDAAIVQHGLTTRRIAWDRLDGMGLAYYSTRRDRKNGWMQLRLRGEGTTIRLDSAFEGFDDATHRAHAAALEKGLELGPVTQGNLAGMGLGEPAAAGAGPGSAP